MLSSPVLPIRAYSFEFAGREHHQEFPHPPDLPPERRDQQLMVRFQQWVEARYPGAFGNGAIHHIGFHDRIESAFFPTPPELTFHPPVDFIRERNLQRPA